MSVRSVEVREPLPRLQARVEQMVLDAGFIPCAADADIILLCADSPVEGWDATGGIGTSVVVASAIRPTALSQIDAVTTLARPFDQASLQRALQLAAETLADEKPAVVDDLEAEADLDADIEADLDAVIEADLDADIEADLDADVEVDDILDDLDAAELGAELPAPAELTPADIRVAHDSRPVSKATVRVPPSAETALRLECLVAAATEIAESVDVLAALSDEDARIEAVLTMLRSHLGE